MDVRVCLVFSFYYELLLCYYFIIIIIIIIIVVIVVVYTCLYLGYFLLLTCVTVLLISIVNIFVNVKDLVLDILLLENYYFRLFIINMLLDIYY